VKTKSKTLFFTFVTLIIFLLGIASFEIYLWTTNSPGSKLRLNKSFDPYLQNRKNERGFSGPDITIDKKPNEFRIFIFGGSTVRSERVAFDKRHTYLLEKQLKEIYPQIDIKVFNLGNHWHTTKHSTMKYLFNVQHYSPDLVIIWHGINDLYQSFNIKRFAHSEYKLDYGHYLGHFSDLYNEMELLKEYKFQTTKLIREFFDDNEDNSAPVTLDPKSLPSLKSFENNLSTFARNVKFHSIPLIIASQPFLYRNDLSDKDKERLWMQKVFMKPSEDTYVDLNSLILGMNAFNHLSKQIADHFKAGFVDLEKIVPKTTEYFKDDCHYTELGNQLIAKSLTKYIQAQKLIVLTPR